MTASAANGENPLAKLWESSYTSVTPQDHLSRRWKLPEDQENPLSIIASLPDEQKPHLPEGYIWFKDQKDLQILKHIDAPTSNFQIHVFGPDKGKRIQYLVTQDVDGEIAPTHGFAMTRREGFPKALRSEYPITAESFQEGTTTYWRGHIIDYDDTLGTPEEVGTISTLFSLNLKPEPQVCWARTLRAKAVAEARQAEGSYGELMLYGFLPQKTNSKRPIPEAVFLEIFNYRGESLHGYFVPKKHECHGWASQKGEKNFALKSLEKLEQKEQFPALVWNKAKPLAEKKITLSSKNLETVDVKEAYHLARGAEMEYESAELKLKYAIYAKHHKASPPTVQFWLKRAADVATKVDTVYQSLRAPFSVCLLDSFSTPLQGMDQNLIGYIDQLKGVAERVIKACSPLAPLTPKDETKKEEPDSIPSQASTEEKFTKSTDVAPVTDKKPIIVFTIPPPVAAPLVDSSPLQVDCKCDLQNPRKLEELTVKVTTAVQHRAPLNLKSVRTAVAKKLFPAIQKEASKISPDYKPVQSVEIFSPRWQATVSKMAKMAFGPEVVITTLKKK